MNAKALTKRAQSEENLVVAGGGLFEVPGDNMNEGTKFDDYIRLCFTFEEEESLGEGVERLGKAIDRMLRGESISEFSESVMNGRDDTNAFW